MVTSGLYLEDQEGKVHRVLAPPTPDARMASFVGKGDEEGLRKVEKDVLITKKMKYKAMDLCSGIIKGIYEVPNVIPL